MRKVPLLLLLLIAAGMLTAQNRANFPWWNSPVVRDIGLTPDQSQKIRETVRSYRNRLLDARNNVLKAEGDLEDIMNGSEVDPNQAKAVIDRLASVRAASSRVFLEMSVQLRSILTLDQWRQLVRRWDEMQRKKPSDTQVPP
ncbi:MAG: periplasmic heavy metal sensor [Acidobacteriaceae bacterium]|nr:periplasmic heavy metal sensor [Acidobacteriaceae bacterium]